MASSAQGFVFDSYGDGFWKIVNRNNNGALIVSGTAASQAVAATTAFEQQFEILYNLDDATFRIRNRDTWMCIGAKNAGTTVGTAVVEVAYTGAAEQRWQWVAAGTDYRIVNKLSGLALQTDAGNPANVTLQAQSSDNRQYWYFQYQTHYPKKGVAGWDGIWGQMGVSWAYNWGDNTGVYLPDSRVFEPMKYQQYWPDTGALGGGYAAMHSTPKPVYIMGFNEPDHTDQANMTVAAAISAWPDLQNQNVPLVSPAAATAFGGWLGDFYNQINSKGYRVDFTAVHWYAYPSADNLINHLQSVYNTWGRPVWLTEFGNVDWSNNQSWSEEDDWRFLAEFMWRAEDLIWLKRYSAFVFNADPPANPWTNSPGTRSNMLKGDNTTLTSIGELYAAWDGDRTVTTRIPYMIQNQQTMFRLSASTANSPFPGSLAQYPSPVSIRISDAPTQWTLLPSPTNGQYYIVSLLDGRRLHTDGNGIDLAAAGTTGVTVQWTINDAGNGYFYIDNPASSKALRSTRYNTNGAPTWIDYGVTPSGSPSDNTRFRLVKPYAPVTVPAATSAPTNLTATAGDHSVSLSWTGTGGSYTVLRSTTSGSGYAAIATGVIAAAYIDNSALNGTTYYYVVSATNILGEASANSAQASATPQAGLTAAGLVANYKFENSTAQDSSDKSQNGALSGSGVTFTAGRVDSFAITLDGVAGYVQIPAVVANDFTIAYWMKTTATGTAGAQWYNGNGILDGEMAGAVADFGTALVGTKLAFGVGNPDTTITSTSAVNDGAWHHIAVTRNNTSGAMQIYVDGALQTSGTGPTGTRSAPTSLRIGCIQTGVRFFAGSLDEVRLYNYVLSATEVNRLANIGNSLIANYTFEGSAQDSSGQGNHGTASNVTYVTGKTGAQAAQFNGTSSYVQIPAPIVGNFSIAYWVKTTAVGGTGQWWAGKGLIDGEVSGAVADFGMSLLGNTAAFGVGNPDTTITSTSAINDGNWHHVAATRVGSTGALKLYVDGALQASAATGPTAGRTAPTALRIGALLSGGGFLNGAIDDVRLYNYTLSASQVAALNGTLPSPWTDSDIGNPGSDGFAGYGTGAIYTVGGGGTDIWGTTDQFNFLSANYSGDRGIVTRVLSTPVNSDGTTTANSKAGLMFRDSSAANAAFVDIVYDHTQGLQFIYRDTTGAASAQSGPNVVVSAPFWLRLFRSGNTFFAFYATTPGVPNSSDWILIGSHNTTLAASALAGIVVTSHNAAMVASATFDNFRALANTPPTISDVTDKSINENTSTSVLPITIGDTDTPLANLALTATSSKMSLVPNANMVLGGTGANRTVQVTPAANQSGTATITLTVSDGSLTATDTFVLTVQTSAGGSWRQQNFGSTASTGNAADSADPDKDGITNLWERAFALDPNSTNDSSVLPIVGNDGTNVTLTYTKNLAATDLNYQVYWSSDLSSWSTNFVTDALISTTNGVELRIAKVPLSTAPKVFLRLQILP